MCPQRAPGRSSFSAGQFSHVIGAAAVCAWAWAVSGIMAGSKVVAVTTLMTRRMVCLKVPMRYEYSLVKLIINTHQYFRIRYLYI